MITENLVHSLSHDVVTFQFKQIMPILDQLNIHLFELSYSPDRLIYVNCDVQLETDNNYFTDINSLHSIGAFSYSQSNLGFGVSVGRYCSLAQNISIMGATHFSDWVSTSPEFYNDGFHDLNAYDITDEQRNKRNVNIGHDVWIGDNVLIGREVTIGHGAIIAANSVVTKDVAPYMIVGGVPAKVIRPRFDEQTIARLLQLQWWRFHKNHLKGLLANKPVQFIDALQERIERGQIQEYHPKIYTLADLLQR